jgi:hypothetical protein
MLFGRKLCRPNQVYAAANAIILGATLEERTRAEDQQLDLASNHPEMSSSYPLVQNSNFFTGNIILCDAAWSSSTEKVGIGVIINLPGNQHCQQVHISALAPPASSPLQAEAYGLHLAAKLADLMHIQEPLFHTDCSVLASAVTAIDIFTAPGHWEVRPLLAQIQSCPSFQRNRIAHIHRSKNVKAHHQARLALKIQFTSLAIRCLSSVTGQCIGKDILAVSCVSPYTLLSVKCA